jgi:hypothetical protein
VLPEGATLIGYVRRGREKAIPPPVGAQYAGATASTIYTPLPWAINEPGEKLAEVDKVPAEVTVQRLPFALQVKAAELPLWSKLADGLLK